MRQSSPTAGNREAPYVVRRVDHLNIVVPDPHALFTSLTDDLGLPVAWPWMRMPGWESGHAGVDVTYEAIRYAPTRSTALRGDPIYAIAFEPAPIHEAIEELAKRALPHSPPLPYTSQYPEHVHEAFPDLEPVRGRSRLFTLVMLGGFLGDSELASRYSRGPFRGQSRVARTVAPLVGRIAGSSRMGDRFLAAMVSKRPFLFLCEFHGFDVRKRRSLISRELESRMGGPLGVRRTREIVVHARDLGPEVERWSRLLRPASETEPGLWLLSDGPAIRLTEGPDDRIAGLVWEVHSLDRAAEWLRAKDWLAGRNGVVRIAPEPVQGIDITLVEAV
jgi:hypothetical protein